MNKQQREPDENIASIELREVKRERDFWIKYAEALRKKLVIATGVLQWYAIHDDSPSYVFNPNYKNRAEQALAKIKEKENEKETID